MKLNGLTPSLLVDNIRTTVDFYHSNFGFEVLTTMPTGDAYEWAMVKRNDVVLMFQAKSALKGKMANVTGSKTGAGISLHIAMEGVEDLFNDVYEEVEMVCELDESPSGGMEFTILDPNGYLVTFSGN